MDRFYRPFLKVSVEKYAKECETCQKFKLAPVKKGELTILKPSEPNEIISLDTAGPLPPTVSGHKHLLVLRNKLTE